MEPRIKWIGHASFLFETDARAIYIDPWKLKNGPRADMILITHSHFDHLSEDDINKIRKKDTVIIGPPDVAEKLPGTVVMRPGETKNFGDVNVEAHPAYNPKKQFHPSENQWLGYVVDIGGYRIYHSGDTDLIPEMKNIKRIDVALLPVGGTYTMTAEEGAEAARIVGAKKAIPMHWGDIIGDKNDALEFKKSAKCEVKILKPTG